MIEPVVRAAFIAGPMYDPLYQSISEFTRTTGIEVSIEFQAAHPELNAHLASLPDVPYHLLSTHTKYAPSQRHFLAALPEDDLDDYFPSLLAMARIDGALYGLPRNMDAKLLHYRTDLVADVPRTWEQLQETAHSLTTNSIYGFVFTGKDSGLFGVFYELAEMGGASLFPADNIPKLNNAGGRWALQTIRGLYQSHSVPQAITEWQFDEAHQFFRTGSAALICDWPGYFSSYTAPDSPIRGKFALARMPAGPLGFHKAYSGAHTFALTTRGVDNPSAHALLHFLTSPEQQLRQAQLGSVPVRHSVMHEVRAQNTQRWELLEQVIATDTLVPPRLAYYPEIEDILWQTVRSAMTGEIEIETALTQMEDRIIACHLRNTHLEVRHAS